MMIRPVISSNIAIKRRPSCKNCKYFRDYNSTEWEAIGVCTLFKYAAQADIKSLNYYVDVEHCRSVPELCGPEGQYFSKK